MIEIKPLQPNEEVEVRVRVRILGEEKGWIETLSDPLIAQIVFLAQKAEPVELSLVYNGGG